MPSRSYCICSATCSESPARPRTSPDVSDTASQRHYSADGIVEGQTGADGIAIGSDPARAYRPTAFDTVKREPGNPRGEGPQRTATDTDVPYEFA